MVHVSAIGADEMAVAHYARSKGEGEAAVRAILPDTVILRPSVVFGPEDQFTNRFAALARVSPIVPLVGAETKLQPVYVGDVASAVADAVSGKAKPGAIYELGGPEVMTMREIITVILKVIERNRMMMALPFGIGVCASAVAAIRAGRAETDARSGAAATRRQCRVGSGHRRRPYVAGIRHRTGFAGGDRAGLSVAFPRHRPVRA